MIPFYKPRIDKKITDAVTDVLNSGWITTGKVVREFEKKLTEYNGTKTTICVNSASSGLELVLRWFGVGIGDEVILPAYTYSATANVIIHCGATPVFVDCGKDFNIDVNAVEKAITTRTKVIIPVDIGGYPCDYDKLNYLVCDKSNLFTAHSKNQKTLSRILILSDAAHSIGSELYGRKAAFYSDITVFSFHAVKNITTGEGGAITFNINYPVNNDEIYKEFALLSTQGQTRSAFEKTNTDKWKYDIACCGYKCNMTDIQAAMGLTELLRYDNDMLIKRKCIFDFYKNFFAEYSWAEIPEYETEDKKTSYHIFMLRIKGISEYQRDAIIKRIYEFGVCVNVHFLPLPLTSCYAELGYNINDYPVSYDNYSREITLPVYYDLYVWLMNICMVVKKAYEIEMP